MHGKTAPYLFKNGAREKYLQEMDDKLRFI